MVIFNSDECLQFSSVAQSCPTLCDPMDCSNPGLPVHHSYPLSRWCHPTISSSVIPFSSWLQSCPASGSFPMSQFFASSGQSIRASDQSFQWTFRTDFLEDGLVGSPSPTHSSKASILQWSAFFIVQLSHSYMTTGKTIGLIRWTFVGKVMSLLLNMLSRFNMLSQLFFQGANVF